MLTNIRSLRYKTDELSAVLSNNNIDICCVNETWLDSSIPTEAVDLEGYVCYRHDRHDGSHYGGVAVYVKQHLACVRLTDVETPALETLWLLYRSRRMPRSMSHILIGAVYHPPDAVSRAMTTHLVDAIDTVMKRHPYAGVIVLGDVNQLNDKPLRDYPLKQIVKSATRGSALLDKIYTTIADWFKPPVVLPNIANSDHCAVMITPVQRGNVRRGERVPVVVRSNDLNGKNALGRELNSVNWLPLYRMTCVESMITFFYSTVTSLVDKHLPERVVIRHTSDKPWITDEFRRLIRKRQHAWSNGNSTEYNRLRNQIIRLSHKLRKRFYEQRIQGLRNCNASNWWRQTKRITGQQNKPNLVGLANTVSGGNIQLLADTINKSLEHVSADLKPLDDTRDTACTDIPEQFIIYPEEIFKKLELINTRKAPGPDNLPNWILKEFAFALCDPICCIFNASIRSRTVPLLWKSANVVPIPKVKPPMSVENDLRPISLTPTLSKILESFVGRWMLDAIGDKFDRKQFGGLPGRSTTHALVEAVHTWSKALDEEKSVRVLFVDYKKAYDHVEHSTVLRKMSNMDIPNFIVDWCRSFLTGRRQRVKIGNILSDWLKLNGGMPQGTWLGLYVFLILINDLEATVSLLKYVDDVTASEVLRRQETSRMQAVADSLADWSSQNFMNINTAKTKEMLLGPINNDPPCLLTIGDNSIERVNSFKLLGVTVTDTLKWEENVSKICAKAGTRLHFLKLLKRAGMPANELINYYKTVIRPVIEYGSTVWQANITDDQTHRLDAVQRRAERIIYCDTVKNDEQLNLTPLKSRFDSQAKRFFQSLLEPTSCLHDILPAARNQDIIGKLRQANKLPLLSARTERYKCSFLPNALSNYQQS